MTNWKELKVYRNLEPSEISKSFKSFAHFILDNLQDKSFCITETKTSKKIYRITEDIEQAIIFDNSNRWAKNQKDIRIDIAIKSLFSKTPEIDYLLSSAWEIDKEFKMFYPLTQEFLLLAEHLTEIINAKLVPFFDKYSTSEKIIANKDFFIRETTTEGQIWECSLVTENLIYDCSFRQRNKKLFMEYNTKFIEWQKNRLEQNNQIGDNSQSIVDIIKELNLEKEIFQNNELYEKEIINQNLRKQLYIENINKKKPSR